MLKEKEDYISLKEAAEMTGYSSDYIGQLIRGGKLPGKQVFSNVSWMTTREAVLEYTQKDKKGKPGQLPEAPKFAESLLTPKNLSRVYSAAGWAVIVVFSIIVLFFAYIVAVSIDHKINASYLEKIEYAR